MKRIIRYAVCVMLAAVVVMSVCCTMCAEGAEIIFSGSKTAVPAWERFITLSTPGNKKNTANHPIFDPKKIKDHSVFVITVEAGYDLGNQTQPVDLVVGTNTDPQDIIDRQWLPVPVTSYADDTLTYTGKDIRATFGADMDDVLECIYVSSRVMNVTLLKVEFYADGLPTSAQTEAAAETSAEAAVETTTVASETATVTEETTTVSEETTTVTEEETSGTEKQTEEQTSEASETTTVTEEQTETITEAVTEQTEQASAETKKESGGQIFRIILIVCAVFMAAVVFFIIKRTRNKYY